MANLNKGLVTLKVRLTRKNVKEWRLARSKISHPKSYLNICIDAPF
jgi:hypothetical protein